MRPYAAQPQADDAANGTVNNRELSALKRIFTLACQAGKLMAAPRIPILQAHNLRRGFFDRAQLNQYPTLEFVMSEVTDNLAVEPLNRRRARKGMTK
jgi:hypothetical protein